LRLAIFGALWLGVYSFTLKAERRVEAGTAAMVINTGPILIATLAGSFLREGLPPRLFAGCAVAFAGCAVAFAGCAVAFAGVVSIGLAKSDSSRSGLGFALLIVAAIAYAIAVVIQKSVLARATRRRSPGLAAPPVPSPACRSRRSYFANSTTPDAL
jgi:drug/metabolite transporter (DMT)-like permease